MATKKTNTPEAVAPKATQPTPVSPAENPEQPAAQAAQSEPDPAEEPATTGDPEGGTLSPEYRGQTAKQIAQKQAETQTAAAPPPELKKTAGDKAPPKPKQADPYEVLATEYAKHYPNNATFHITRDKQVFLAGDRNLAVLHQSTLQTEEKVHSINVKR